MRRINIILTIAFFFLASCMNKHADTNSFSGNDTVIVLKTIKHKGFGLLGPGAFGDLFFTKVNKDVSAFFHVPETIEGVEMKIVFPDFNVPKKVYENGSIDSTDYFKWLKKGFIDTTVLKILSDSKCYLIIVKGKINDSTFFIIDQNNNQDLSDDTLRTFKPIQQNSTASLISFDYRIDNDSDIVPATSWINIGIYPNGDTLFCTSQHVSSSFFINDTSYTIAVAPWFGCAFHEYIKFALIEENGVYIDTLSGINYNKLGDYLKLGNQYYKFESITNDGSYITLRKEDNFSDLTGTQIGMIAPDFTCCTINGDSIFSNDYKGKYLLIINVSACWSKKSSYKCYKDLTEIYNGEFEYIGIDNSPSILRNNIKSLKLSGPFVIAEDNPMIQASYRPDYCSRTCFLISPEGRIIDKFEIFDWDSILLKHFAKENL